MKKLSLFVVLIGLIVSCMLVMPKTKALELYTDYNAMVISWDDSDNVWIAYFDGDISSVMLFNPINVVDTNNNQILLGYGLINGTKINVSSISTTPANKIVGTVVSEYKLKADLVDTLTYRYLKTESSYYYFMRGTDVYKLALSDVSIQNSISGVIEYTTTLLTDNIYTYVAFNNSMRFSNSYDYQYELATTLAGTDINNAYNLGKEEGLTEGKEIGNVEGKAIGLTEGEVIGYDKGYQKAIDDLALTGEYQTGYNAGLKDKQVANNALFYANIEKWLVPAIIVVVFLGGFVTFANIKKRQE